MDDEEKLELLKKFVETLGAEQKPIPPEFAKVIEDNFWDLL
jgi:hypothetical protein